jgi:hypothetical protein
MNKLSALTAVVWLLTLPGCGGNSEGSGPPKLWLALNGDELHVKLQAVEPPPY